ncbi:hypothetical protein EVJ58_g5895, partial [Rhodofomes roseus]
HSVSARRDALYKSRGLDVERWLDLVGERRALHKEIGKIAEDYDERVWKARQEERDERQRDISSASGDGSEEGEKTGDLAPVPDSEEKERTDTAAARVEEPLTDPQERHRNEDEDGQRNTKTEAKD